LRFCALPRNSALPFAQQFKVRAAGIQAASSAIRRATSGRARDRPSSRGHDQMRRGRLTMSPNRAASAAISHAAVSTPWQAMPLQAAAALEERGVRDASEYAPVDTCTRLIAACCQQSGQVSLHVSRPGHSRARPEEALDVALEMGRVEVAHSLRERIGARRGPMQ
jgi:hypothetical protein